MKWIAALAALVGAAVIWPWGKAGDRRRSRRRTQRIEEEVAELRKLSLDEVRALIRRCPYFDCTPGNSVVPMRETAAAQSFLAAVEDGHFVGQDINHHINALVAAERDLGGDGRPEIHDYVDGLVAMTRALDRTTPSP